MAEAIGFYVVTGLMLASACSVVLTRKPIYSVLSLLAVMLCVAALFVLLGAFFLAAIQVLLYAGAVLVLFLFIMMLLNLAPELTARARLFTLRAAGTGAAILLGVALLNVFTHSGGRAALPAVSARSGTVESMGRVLFTEYLLPFELTSFLILAAIIGAVTLAKTPDTDR